MHAFHASGCYVALTGSSDSGIRVRLIPLIGRRRSGSHQRRSEQNVNQAREVKCIWRTEEIADGGANEDQQRDARLGQFQKVSHHLPLDLLRISRSRTIKSTITI